MKRRRALVQYFELTTEVTCFLQSVRARSLPWLEIALRYLVTGFRSARALVPFHFSFSVYKVNKRVCVTALCL